MAVYSWGLGNNGELGTGRKNTEHVPQHITKTSLTLNGNSVKLSLVKSLDCGALFTVIVTAHGQVYSTGCGKHGRLGQGDGEKDTTTFAPVNCLSSVKQVSCGSWHAACVTEDGQMFIWGFQKAYLGLSTQCNSSIPLPLSVPDSCRIKGVSCGHNFTFAWSEDGRLFSWGKGQHGVLGQGSETDLASPQPVKSLDSHCVVSVGAGHSHCGIVTQDGQVYMTGKGACGALGLGKSNLSNAVSPTVIDIEEKITAVSCSKGEHHGHTLALTNDGRVLAWGDGYKGKLGFGNHDSVYIPTAIDFQHFNKSVISICAGGIHSAAATQQGHVYTWGCGSDGRLGHPEGQGHRYLFRSDIPKRVEGLPESKTPSEVLVSCAYYHTAAVI